MATTMAVTDARSGTDRLTSREQLAGVFLGGWMVVGLFLDGWAHDNNRPETFFTPWHGVLYSGFFATAAAALAVARWSRRPGRAWWAGVPEGHIVTLAGLGAFFVGAVGDLVWHEVLGIEVGVEALLSPTHLVLLVGGLLALSAPLRMAWSVSEETPPSLIAFLPVVLSLALLTALVGFFLLYLSPWVNDAAGTAFNRAPGAQHDHPSSAPGELRQLLGLASILMTTVVLIVPYHVLHRRWRPPPGSVVVLFTVVVALFVGLNEFRQPSMLLCGVTGGALAELASRRLPTWLAGAVAIVALWMSYFALYQVAGTGVAWTAELWTGAAFLSGLIAAGVGLLTVAVPTPPAPLVTVR